MNPSDSTQLSFQQWKDIARLLGRVRVCEEQTELAIPDDEYDALKDAINLTLELCLTERSGYQLLLTARGQCFWQQQQEIAYLLGQADDAQRGSGILLLEEEAERHSSAIHHGVKLGLWEQDGSFLPLTARGVSLWQTFAAEMTRFLQTLLLTRQLGSRQNTLYVDSLRDKDRLNYCPAAPCSVDMLLEFGVGQKRFTRGPDGSYAALCAAERKPENLLEVDLGYDLDCITRLREWQQHPLRKTATTWLQGRDFFLFRQDPEGVWLEPGGFIIMGAELQELMQIMEDLSLVSACTQHFSAPDPEFGGRTMTVLYEVHQKRLKDVTKYVDGGKKFPSSSDLGTHTLGDVLYNTWAHQPYRQMLARLILQEEETVDPADEAFWSGIELHPEHVFDEAEAAMRELSLEKVREELIQQLLLVRALIIMIPQRLFRKAGSKSPEIPKDTPVQLFVNKDVLEALVRVAKDPEKIYPLAAALMPVTRSHSRTTEDYVALLRDFVQVDPLTGHRDRSIQFPQGWMPLATRKVRYVDVSIELRPARQLGARDRFAGYSRVPFLERLVALYEETGGEAFEIRRGDRLHEMATGSTAQFFLKVNVTGEYLDCQRLGRGGHRVRWIKDPRPDWEAFQEEQEEAEARRERVAQREESPSSFSWNGRPAQRQAPVLDFLDDPDDEKEEKIPEDLEPDPEPVPVPRIAPVAPKRTASVHAKPNGAVTAKTRRRVRQWGEQLTEQLRAEIAQLFD